MEGHTSIGRNDSPIIESLNREGAEVRLCQTYIVGGKIMTQLL